MKKLPIPLTVISWVLIVVGGLAVIFGIVRSAEGETFRSQAPLVYAGSVVGPILAVACGFLMLMNSKWARWVLLLWFVESALVNMVYSPLRVLPFAVLFAVAGFYLVCWPRLAIQASECHEAHKGE